MRIRILTQRQWHYTGRWIALQIPKRTRRSFLCGWDAYYEFWQLTRTAFFFATHPRLWLQYRRALRIVRAGRTEIAL